MRLLVITEYFPGRNGYVIGIRPADNRCFIVSEDFYDSVFNKLFILNNYNNGFFRPVLNRHGIVQVWEVM